MPQLALQHTRPSSQVALPQAVPGPGTGVGFGAGEKHLASPFSALQTVPSGQSARLHGSSGPLGTQVAPFTSSTQVVPSLQRTRSQPWAGAWSATHSATG